MAYGQKTSSSDPFRNKNGGGGASYHVMWYQTNLTMLNMLIKETWVGLNMWSQKAYENM